MEVLKSLLSSATANLSNLLIYVIIVAVFLLGLICCILPVLGTRRKLRGAIRAIKAGDKSKRSWQEDEFLGKGSLLAHWSAYLNNLFFADGVYHNASNVEDFINEETVIYGPGRAAFSDAVPSLLVSLGFLGTLIGLAQGLSGFDMADSAAAQHSIMVLIPGMKYAFTTSIYGVVSSVLFTLITRAVYGSTEHTLRSFYGAMSRYAGVISVDPMTQVAIYQQEQTALIQTMSRDLNGKVTNRITEAMQEATQPLTQCLKDFTTVTAKEQMRFLDTVIVRFVDRMDELIGGQLKALGHTIERTNQGQEEAFAAIRETMSSSGAALRDLTSMRELSAEMVQTMHRYLDDLRHCQMQTDDAYQRVAESVEQMDLVSRQQSNYLKTVSAMQAEVTRTIDTMTGAVNTFTQRFAEENAAASRSMQTASDALRETGRRMEEIQKNATAAIDAELKDTMDAYREYVNQFTQRIDYLAAGISDALSAMPQAVEETSDRFLDQIDRMSHALEDAQRALNDAVDRLHPQQ